MIQLLHRFLEYRTIFISILFILIGGVLGGFISATVLFALHLLFSKKNKLEFLFALLILTFFLGDNFSGPFSFMQNFRFIVLGLGILYLLRYKVLQKNNANDVLLFSLVAFSVTLLFSPLGIMALLRAASFWLVALVIFKMVALLYARNAQRTSELLVLIFTLYFGVNLLLLFLPFLEVYQLGRFKGLTGNPNGFALIAMFAYAILSLINKRKETTFKKTFFLVFKGALFSAILLTGSRTALFSVLAFQFTVILINNKALLLPFFAALGVLYVVFNSMVLGEFINYLGFSEYLRAESLSDASGRTDVWPVAWEEIKKSPWLGNGIMYDNYFIAEYVEKYVGDSAARQWGGVWSSYLSLLLDVGVIGCMAYAYFWIKAFKKSQHKNTAIAFVVMCLLSGITESWMAASMNAFTPMMFLFWAIQSHPVNKMNNKE